MPDHRRRNPSLPPARAERPPRAAAGRGRLIAACLMLAGLAAPTTAAEQAPAPPAPDGAGPAATAAPAADPAAAAPTRAGWIHGFDGPPAGYRLTRAGAELPVGHLMPLLAGDRIEVRAPDALLRIQLNDGTLLELSRAQGPYTLPVPAAAPGAWGRLMSRAGDWLGELHTAPAPARTVTTVTRGEDETAPASGLFFPDTVGLPAGTAPLALAWRGGRPPFRLSITPAAPDTGTPPAEHPAPTAAAAPAPATPPLLAETGIATRSHRTAPVALPPGDYDLAITDAEGRTLSTRLIAVPPADLPAPDPAELPADLPAETRATLTAAWLASQADGWLWRLAAYQHIAALDAYAPAALLRAALVAEAELPPGP
jgi:hypothetical protein